MRITKKKLRRLIEQEMMKAITAMPESESGWADIEFLEDTAIEITSVKNDMDGAWSGLDTQYYTRGDVEPDVNIKSMDHNGHVHVNFSDGSTADLHPDSIDIHWHNDGKTM